MKIKCIKIPKYKTNLKDDKKTYNYLYAVGLQIRNPPSENKNVFRFEKNSIIFHSSLKRSLSSLNKKDHNISLKELNEIPFDLKKMCTFKEWKIDKSKIVRKKFKDFFIADKLPLKRKVIFSEIRKIIRIAGKYKNKKVYIISHSFRLKILEAFIKTKGKIEGRPKLIHKYLFDNKKTYEFGESFTLEI